MREVWSVGLMSGTSRDGVDAALIRTDGSTKIEFHGFINRSYDPYIREKIKKACESEGEDLGSISAASELITEAHILAVQDLLADYELKESDIYVVGFHGHTINHDPIKAKSIQIGNAQKLASSIGINVVHNFRDADLKAGGQGAPLTPAFHAALSADMSKPIAVLNIGGVSNVTWMGSNFSFSDLKIEDFLAFDIGPGCALLDDWVNSKLGYNFDEDGKFSAMEEVDQDILLKLLSDPYFLRVPPKSLDRDYFELSEVKDLGDFDGAATLAQFTIQSIVKSVDIMPSSPLSWVVCGGGRKNLTILSGLRSQLNSEVLIAEFVGWDGDAIEAQAFGWLAVRSAAGLPLSYPTTTGVVEPQTGGILISKDL